MPPLSTSLSLACLGLLALSAPAEPLAPTASQEGPAIQVESGGALRGAAVGAQDAEAEDPRTEDRVRIVATSQGTFLRTRAYLDGDVWQVRIDREWRAFPVHMIVSAVAVRDLEREARKLERDLDMQDPDQRVELAAWYADNGMLEDALELLDKNLRKDPVHPATHALLVPERFPVRFDQALPSAPQPAPDADPFAVWTAHTQDVLDALAKYPPAAGELMWQQLDPAFTAPENHAAFLHALTTELTSRSARRRAQASAALRRLAATHLAGTTSLHQNAVRTLVARCALDGSEDVRTHSALALGALDEPAVAAPLVRALASPSGSVRLNVIESLGVLALPSTAPALIATLAATNAASGLTRPPASHIFIGKQTAYLQDYDVELANSASIADPQIGVIQEGAVLDVRIVAAHTRMVQVQHKSALRKALVKITGVDHKYDDQAWAAHLAENTPETGSGE